MTVQWKPGDVVAATVNGRPNVRLVAGWSKYDPQLRWCELSPRWANGDDDECWFTPSQVTDHRPLAVIDPEDREQVARLTEMFWVNGSDDADDPKAMADALREFANPKPPKPEEPTGLGAVVLAHAGSGNREHVVRGGDSAERRPWVDPVGDWHSWADLREVEIVSEGVTP